MIRNKLLLLPFGFIFLLNSCSKEQKVCNKIENASRVTLYASFNNTRSSLADEDLGQIVWNERDSICLFCEDATGGSKFTAKHISDDGSHAEFEGSIKEGASRYVGLYPYYSESIFNDSESSVMTQIPPIQYINSDGSTFDPKSFISVGASKNLTMGFYNICGGIRFTVEKAGYKKIILKGNNDEPIAGEIKVFVNDSTSPKVSTTDNSSKEVTLICENGFCTETYYYITFIPQTFENGFSMTFCDNQGKSDTRECKSLVSTRRSAYSTIHFADKDGVLDGIMDGPDISDPKSSNCYVISEPGSYKFKMVKGNSTEKVDNVSYVDILWETNNSKVSCPEHSIIEKCSLKREYLCFRTPKNLANGNALLAAFDANNNILWSWHIWCCADYDPSNTSQIYVNKSIRVLDRNLGALSSTQNDPMSCGLMYQWGRKDPFMGAASLTTNDIMISTHPAGYELISETKGTVSYAVANPNIFLQVPSNISFSQDWVWEERDNTLWADNKTKYDPCPPGWKVPSEEQSPWVGCTSYNWLTHGAYYSCSTGGDAWYPANGFLSCEGVLCQSGSFADYWTVTGNSQFVSVMEIYLKPGSEKVYPSNGGGKIRSEGHSVRCVEE